MKQKRSGFELDVRSFHGKGAKGQAYLVFRTGDGAYHAFVEVEAKDVARECGAKREGSTRQMWNDLWKRRRA